jgi:hypothetical protein
MIPMRWHEILAAFLVTAACGSSPPAARPTTCDAPEPGAPMTEAQCTCRGGNVTLALGRAVELHCEPGEVELGVVRMGDRDGWCCAPS